MVVEKKCEYVLRYRTSSEKWRGIATILAHMGYTELAKLAQNLTEYIEDRGDVALPHGEEACATIRDLSDIPYRSKGETRCPHCVLAETVNNERNIADTKCEICVLYEEDYECCKAWETFREEFENIKKEMMKNESESI